MPDDDSGSPGGQQRQAGRTERVTAAGRLAELLRGPFDVKSFSLTALFVFATFCAINFMRPVLLPLVLALLLSYLLAPIVRALAKCLRLPPLFGAGVVLLCVIGLVAVAVTRLTVPAKTLVEQVPESVQRLQDKLKPLKKPIQTVSAATVEIEKMTAPETAPPSKHSGTTTTIVTTNHSGVISKFFLSQTPDFLAQALTMVILLYFLLAYDGLFLGKLIKAMPRLQDKKRALTIAREIESSISKYLVTVTCINAGLGTAVGVAVGLLGMPNPLLWGVMAMVFNFVPYLGATVGIISMTLAAVLSFDSLTWALIFPTTYLAIAIIEGNFITPMILGHSLTVNPIVILIALMFWGWMWGIPGAMLAVPILATFKIFCDHVQPLAPIGEFLST